MGVSFGRGNPKVHLAYLTKLRILPQAVRRKIDGKIQGCYPQSAISTIQRAEELKNSGLTYSQVRWQLSSATNYAVLPNYNLNQILLLVVGLLLGYLIGTRQYIAPSSGLGTAAALANSPIDRNTQVYVKLITADYQDDLIAVPALSPKENLYRLDKVNIDSLVR